MYINSNLSINEYTWPGGTYSPNSYAIKKNVGVVEIFVNGLQNMSANSDYKLITLPEDYRPINGQKIWDVSAPGGDYCPVRFTVDAQGVFACHVYSAVGNLGNICCTLTYIR